MKKVLLLSFSCLCLFAQAQEQKMTKELLWQLGRVSALGLSNDGKYVYYQVATPNVKDLTSSTTYWMTSVDGKMYQKLDERPTNLSDTNISPDGKYRITVENIKVEKVLGKDYYPEMTQSEAYIYDGLDYRHWDTWSDGTYNHIIVENIETGEKVDILKDEPYHSPQKTFGGSSDYTWSPAGDQIIYVSKKLSGTNYALSTNTDLYAYDIKTGVTTNLTEYNKGYDTRPSFSPQGHLTWLQMKRDGYEADKNDIIVRYNDMDHNLTAYWDGTVDSYIWSKDGKKIYFTAPIDGTVQLFEVNFPGNTRMAVNVRQITKGDFDITGIVGFSGDRIVTTRTDFNTATEIYSYDLKRSRWTKVSHANDEIYKRIAKSKVERKYVTTTDGKQMLVYVILPPDFNPHKKYPTLLYCQGGPQSPLSQFYSFRWNFQLMAAEGYVIVAPNRRGMPGFGVEWNEAISKDWGGQVMDDYLTAIDEVSKENYVDKERLGAVGASYGGYSVFYLAGIHENRFKTFISHCGVFNLESMYGTTEEVFFPNWDTGGAYWEEHNPDAMKAYYHFNPIKNVKNWNTPMLIIHGGEDYRVPIGQGQEAFQAAQLRGIKSRFVYFPYENHWVTQAQNAQVWQGEFFRWLKETL